MFEGPGQGGVMRLQGMHFTHEWEKPVKAVIKLGVPLIAGMFIMV